MKNTILIVSIAVATLIASNWLVTSYYSNKVIKSQPQVRQGGRDFGGFMNDTNRMARMEEMRKQREAREQEYLKTLSPTEKANYEKMKKQMEEQRGNRPDFGQGFGRPPRDR